MYVIVHFLFDNLPTIRSNITYRMVGTYLKKGKRRVAALHQFVKSFTPTVVKFW